MRLIGYVAVLVSIYLLFVNKLALGAVVFSVGLFVSCGFKVNSTIIGVVLMVIPSSYIFHNGISIIAFALVFFGFVIVCLAHGKPLDNYHYDDNTYYGDDSD